ncbi:type II toxin-antitoxin system RelE/ParE family toxin [Candidatus Poribacteria bacterium]|nr:type II toxin-antitoxin system RelE/ParE family toxin [Candidatus Poribacteria bacterium]
MPYEVLFTKEAFKDIEKLTPKLKKKLKDIILNQIVKEPKAGKKLIGDLTGFYSLRLTYKDRIIYSIDEINKIIYIHRAKTHYGE